MQLTSERYTRVRSGSRPAQILVVGDSAMLRDEIRAMYDQDDGIEVVGEAANSWEAFQKVRQLAPDAVHLAMLSLDSLELLYDIHRQSPAVRVVCTFHGDSGPSHKMWIFKPVSQKATESRVPSLSSL